VCIDFNKYTSKEKSVYCSPTSSVKRVKRCHYFFFEEIKMRYITSVKVLPGTRYAREEHQSLNKVYKY